MVNHHRMNNKNVRFNLPLGTGAGDPARRKLIEHLRRNFGSAHTPIFTPDDDAISRLIKVTMINENYKRDLKNN